MPERIIEYTVPSATAAGRADKILAAVCEDVSRARIQRAFEEGAVTLDGCVIGKKQRVAAGGRLRAVLSDPDLDGGPMARPIPLEIVFEDAHLVVVNKVPGMIVHPGSGTGDDTLVHALLHHCGQSLSTVGAPDRPGIVHRLDKETSGLIAVAKSDLAHHRLAEAFSGRHIFKRYVALVAGHPALQSGTVAAPIARHPVVRTRMSIQPGGREARTDWSVVESFGKRAALLSCRIHTGRTHQIRVHMSHLGLPLLGDSTYGFKAARFDGPEVPRVMLHAAELRLAHPVSGVPLDLSAPVPGDFKQLIDQLRPVG